MSSREIVYKDLKDFIGVPFSDLFPALEKKNVVCTEIFGTYEKMPKNNEDAPKCYEVRCKTEFQNFNGIKCDEIVCYVKNDKNHTVFSSSLILRKQHENDFKHFLLSVCGNVNDSGTKQELDKKVDEFSKEKTEKISFTKKFSTNLIYNLEFSQDKDTIVLKLFDETNYYDYEGNSLFVKQKEDKEKILNILLK